MNILLLLKGLVMNRKSLFKTILRLAVAFLLALCINLHSLNKKLSESLEMANNNIEAYLGIVKDSLLANNVLKLDIESLQLLNDNLLKKVDSVRNELKIKPKEIRTIATQTQVLYVNASKGVGGNLIDIIKDSTYTDSIKYNDYTTIQYSITKDTVQIGLDISNTQYLYVYSKREYKNKKSFLKRLFTLDFKKVNKYKYEIVNTNDLLNSTDVRVIESNK